MAASLEFNQYKIVEVSTHSHPKVAACSLSITYFLSNVSTHSHPKVAASGIIMTLRYFIMFQHTATRRWLRLEEAPSGTLYGFNTQPPEGGCNSEHRGDTRVTVSTHSHPKVAAQELILFLSR